MRKLADIAEKYIIDGETMNLALMFIPSHQVFNYINEHSKNWIDKARLKGVQIVSPTTLWIALKSYRLFAEGYIMNENSSKILTEMKLIIEDVSRLSKRIGTIEKKHVEISEEFRDEILNGRVKVMIIPAIESVNYGRDVGYKIIEHKPPEEIRKIKGRELRSDIII